jgi:hypothetical protein
VIRVKTLPLAAALVVAMFGGVFVSKAMGYWVTTNTKQPAKFKTGELAGLPNPSDIRGSYTWLDVEKAFGISAVEAAAVFSAPGFVLDPAGRVSSLETYYKERLPADKEVGTDSVRLFVALLTGLPHTPEDGTALPAAAVDYLAARGKANEAALKAKLDTALFPAAAAAAHEAPAATAQPAPATAAAPAAAPAPKAAQAPAPETHVEGEIKVGGSTTFGNLRSWGLSDAEIEKLSGVKPLADDAIVRDAVQAAGKSFSEVKTPLQAAAEAKQK